MAIKTISPFYPRGPGLQNGEKLNRIFGYAQGGTIGVAADQVPALNVKNLTATTIHGSTGIQTLALAVTATANTDFTMLPPAGAIIGDMTVYTTTAFGAATDAQIEIGSAVGGAQYVALTSIKAAGVVVLSAAATSAAAAALLSLPAAGLFIRIVQTGTTSATGAATLAVAYTVP